MSFYHALAKSANIGDSINRGWNQLAGGVSSAANMAWSPFRSVGQTIYGTATGGPGLGGFVQGGVDGFNRGATATGQDLARNAGRMTYGSATGQPLPGAAAPSAPISAAPPAGKPSTPYLGQRFDMPGGTPQGAAGPASAAPAAPQTSGGPPQSQPVTPSVASGVRIPSQEWASSGGSAPWQHGDPSRSGWQGGGPPLADVPAGQSPPSPGQPPNGGAYQSVGRPAAPQRQPDYQALFRNTHGSYNPNSREDQEKMQQMQQFAQQNPDSANWTPNTFSRNFYRR